MKKRFLANSPFRFSFIILTISLILSCAGQVEKSVLASDYYNIGLSYHELSQFEKAEFYYKKSILMDDSGWDCQFNLALLYIENDMPALATPYLNELYKRDEQNLTIMSTLGVVYSMLEEWDKALLWYNRTLEVFPWDKRALYNSYLIHVYLEDTESALSKLETLWERDKSYRTAKALIELNDELTPIELITLLEEAETDDEGEIMELSKTLIDSYVDQDREEEALFLIESLLGMEREEEGWLLFKQGEILITLFRTEEGLASIQDAFREGYHDSNAIDSLVERLSPKVSDVLLNLEQLYFPLS